MATQVVQRANNSSNLYATIKSRGSNSGPAGCGYIYASEVNQCPCWRHKLKVTPQNSPGYDRTVRFELPNYGFLENVFLETLFSANSGMDGTGDGTSVDNALCWGAGAYVFSEVRLVFRGQEVARLSSDYILARHLQDLSEERLDNFLDMVGGLPVGSPNTAASGATNRTGRYKLAEGKQRYYCPLSFWFAETRSRALDLSILHSPITIEVDVRPFSGIQDVNNDAGATDIALEELNLQCFLAELPAPELKMFRDVSYKPGGEPLSQLGYDILTSTHTVDVSTTKTHNIKLNDFSGLVQRLYVYAVKSADRDANHYLRSNDAITTIKLMSVDTDIYERENMDYFQVTGQDRSTIGTAVPLSAQAATSISHQTGERLMDHYMRPSKNLEKNFVCFDAQSDAGKVGAQVAPSCIHTINFKSDWDQRTSATGSISFGTLHNPTLSVTFEDAVSGSMDIIVIAELNNLVLYSTNGAGATSIRRITE